MLTETDYRIRLAIFQSFVDGVRPTSAILAPKVRLPQQVVYESFERLRLARVLVLDPNSKEIQVAMPFSVRQTPFRVVSHDHLYYACSAWDAFGIALMINRNVAVATTCADCDAPIVHRVEQRHLVDAHGVAHFPGPASRWWDNMAFTLEMTRFFRNDDHVLSWSAQVETPIGAIVPIADLWQLSRHWFDHRMSPDWRKPSREMLQELLHDHGFTGAFWSLSG